MNEKTSVKKQIILLGVILILMIILSIIVNIQEKSKQDNKLLNTNSTDNISNQQEVLNGMNEQQLENMKGLMDNDTYNEYKEYFDNDNTEKEEIINTPTAESLIENGETVDYISDEEQEELNKELEEALKNYGYDTVTE